MNLELRPYFKAGYPAISIDTIEEKRALLQIRGEVFELDKDGNVKSNTQGLFERILIWNPKVGLRDLLTDAKFAETQDIFQVLEKEVEENTLYIFCDMHMYPLSGDGADPVLNRCFREFIDGCPAAGSCIIFLSPHFDPPPEWERSVVPVNFNLPDRDDLAKILDSVLSSIKESKNSTIKLDNGERDLIIGSAQGMSTDEAANAFALACVRSNYKTICHDVVHQEKISAINRSGMLDYIDTKRYSFDMIGGLDELKDWWLKRKGAMSKEAREFGCDPVKGILLVGVPGTGKSLSAKSVGAILELPTLRLDVGKLFGSLVGQSEAQTRRMQAIAEASAPLVLWIDEIEKGFAGSGSSGEHDSGVTARVFGSMLTWLEERDPARPVIIVATANQIENLPPEFLRKGRFDEIFAVDLPNIIERQQIFEIHLAKRGRDPKKFNLKRLVKMTDEFTGSEIEEVVRASLFHAFSEGEKELEMRHMEEEIEKVKPLALTMKGRIDMIRQWIGERARSASSSLIETEAKKTARKLK